MRKNNNKKKMLLFSGLLLLAALIIFAGSLFFRNSDQQIKIKDEGNMVQIPAGRFLMGSKENHFDEQPVHEVSLSSFKIERYEVTYKDYQKFLEDNSAWKKGEVTIDQADLSYLLDWEGLTYPQGKENHPVVYVSWFAARAYAEWIGKKLPTEAQWEYASRGGLGKVDYPWGNEFVSHLARWRGSEGRGVVRVGSYAINGFGLNDMAGNAREWTADGYELYQEKKEFDPLPNINNHLKVVRGGSWRSEREQLQVSARQKLSPNVSLDDLGFRCVAVE